MVRVRFVCDSMLNPLLPTDDDYCPVLGKHALSVKENQILPLCFVDSNLVSEELRHHRKEEICSPLSYRRRFLL